MHGAMQNAHEQGNHVRSVALSVLTRADVCKRLQAASCLTAAPSCHEIYLRKLRAGVRLLGPRALHGFRRESCATRKHAEAADILGTMPAVTHLAEGEPAPPFWQQADIEANTLAAFDARHSLRHEPPVLAGLQRLWTTAIHSSRYAGGRLAAHPTDVAATLRWGAYATMMHGICTSARMRIAFMRRKKEG